MAINNFNILGLSDAEVNTSRSKYGSNKLSFKKESGFIVALLGLLKEPMVILLLVTSSIYFISGKSGDAIFLALAILVVAGISLYQDSRSRNALEKLKNISQPECKVVRNGKVLDVKSSDLVVGDSLMVEEGTSVTADGIIVHSNDFSVNESILTGESLAVFKDKFSANNLIFQGTTVASGLAIATITAIGNQTSLGKIGKSLESIMTQRTPLEIQINNFVKKMVIVGTLVFLVVWAINYLHSADLLDSLTKALTLAMSILPEEIPVAFTTFMALGAWRLMKMGIVVKQMKTVETLGSASVICTDKTGTLTENKMSLAKVYSLQDNRISDTQEKVSNVSVQELITLAMWASEPIPFDPMEIALHDAYSKTGLVDERPDYHMIHEYLLGGKPPMMTHLFENRTGKRIIAAKGAPEALISNSKLDALEKKQIAGAVQLLAAEGYRILAVGEVNFLGNDFPVTQQEFAFKFVGLVAFYDPPKENITAVLQAFYKAGIAVKIITGDNAETTSAIARQIGFRGFELCISGEELMQLSKEELKTTVGRVNIFTRMFPEAKLRIVKALRSKGEIVAMTGDGVNDGPALKAAHIGIAMGKKGTEIAKQAASLILLEDDLSKMVDAIAMGRRIYTNLKKAIQYIISIHIPIILTVFIPLALGWIYPNIFLPVHVIFLELIMGPTCSIIYENEPVEQDAMLQRPRPFSTTFFTWKELTTSVIQGLVITAGSLMIYHYAVSREADEQLTRTMVFTCLISANISLTMVNRSFYYSLFTTIRYKNNLVLIIIGITVLISGLLIYFDPFANFFGFEPLSLLEFTASVSIGFLSVIWFELFKWQKRLTASKNL
ncbi:cation-translocating P-type ATPase [Pedobacter psychroterrae]|uniref:Cation-translocating P-type ATPase n=1 Tax=Pedobacter psychroterrae TaxID=2530453 RepID=A0A4R0NLL9_9SPHI|nr:cation-translocating P-type ATPase [Pedobacter psychroterrae]TCD01536.1 cation-translocating P-type ATPase [Pedobacter psychroterrae]